MIIELLQFEFFWRALIVAVIVGFTLPALGIFLILRRLSLIADTLSHVALAGIAIGTLTPVAAIYAALPVTMVASLTIEELRYRERLPGDTVLALALYASLAVSLIIFNATSGLGANLIGFLFGNIVSISTLDLVMILTIGVITIITIFILTRELSQIALSQRLAIANGVNVRLVNRVFAVLVGACVVAAMIAVGVLMVGALLVIPALIALRLRPKSTYKAILLASLFGVITAVGGLLIAVLTDLAPSPVIVATGIGLLILFELARLARQRLKTVEV